MKIAIVKLSALGDIIHAMIVLQYIKKHNKNIKIDWIVEEGYKELKLHNAWLRENKLNNKSRKLYKIKIPFRE